MNPNYRRKRAQIKQKFILLNSLGLNFLLGILSFLKVAFNKILAEVKNSHLILETLKNIVHFRAREGSVYHKKMSAHLSGGRVNIAQWREAARRDLLGCLDKCIGSKVRKLLNLFSVL